MTIAAIALLAVVDFFGTRYSAERLVFIDLRTAPIVVDVD